MEEGEYGEWRKGGELQQNKERKVEVEVQRIWKEYFDWVQRGNYFGREPIRKTEVNVRVEKLKDVQAASKDEVTREIIKDGTNRVV